MLARTSWVAAVWLALTSLATPAPAWARQQGPIPPVQPLPRPPEGPGRVVATISVLEGTVRMAGVEVELKTAGEKMTLAKTITDGAGQVSFPDVPPGRYFISATRPGFVSQGSAQFDVRSGETAQVLLDIHLAFTVPPVEVRGCLAG